MEDNFVARVGDVVTCENGHVICTVAGDIKPGSDVRPEQFTDWQIPKPHDGDAVSDCPTCGAPYILARGGYPHGAIAAGLHLSTGWRTMTDAFRVADYLIDETFPQGRL